MRTLTVWMEYSVKSEIEVEVEDDFVIPERLDEYPSEWLRDLDAGPHEMIPQDWGVDES